MRIAIDIRSLGDENITGIGVYVMGMLAGLQSVVTKYGDEIVLWYSGGSHTRSRIRQRAEKFHFPMHEIRLANKIFNVGQVLFGSVLRGKLPRADIYWLPNIHFFTNNGTPVAITVHDLSFLHYPLFYSLKRRLWHRIVLSQKLLQRARLICTVSESTKQDVQRFFPLVPANRIVVIPLGTPSTDTRTSVPVSTLPERYILFVGTIEPRKNLRALLGAFEIIERSDPSIHLVLVGGVGWSARSITRRFKNNPKIHWLGFVREEQKNYLMTHALMFVWPSFYEGYGFPPMESLRHGTPVVTSYRTSLPEILGCNAYYVNPYNPRELAEVLLTILMDTSASRRHPVDLSELGWDDAARRLLQSLHHAL